MQLKRAFSDRYVHIIFFWLIGLFSGMYLAFGFRNVFLEHFSSDLLSQPSFTALFAGILLPIVLALIAGSGRFYFLLYILVSCKAFLYGFSLLAYGVVLGRSFGAISGLFLLSQNCCCILFLFLCFILIHTKTTKKLSCLFITANSCFVILDYFLTSFFYNT